MILNIKKQYQQDKKKHEVQYYLNMFKLSDLLLIENV